MFEVRPYQDDAVSHANKMLDERGNSLIVAGTGAGKTIMMAETIRRYINGFIALHKRRPHILVLVHRTEIHDQNHSKFTWVCPNVATSEITSNRKSLKGNVHFGMVQTVSNLLPEFQKTGVCFDLIVIDEAHHAAASTYEDIINYNKLLNPNTAILGVTATPNRGDKLPLIHLWDNFYQITTKFLIDSHYLIRPKFLDLSPTFKRNGDKGHLARYITDDEIGQDVIGKLCDDYLERKEPGKTVIFAPSHEFCQMIYEALKKKGRNPAYLSLGLDDETRKSELERFEKGDCDELINVDICTEGYDYPELRNLVDFDTNGTHGQWVQKVGRVLRTCPGKTSCTVIDFGGNVDLYPEGVETTVNLEGEHINERGKMLTEDDFFEELEEGEYIELDSDEERGSSEIVGQYDNKWTPYHLPKGFETVNDSDYGIVYVACGPDLDCIIVERNEIYNLYIGDKTSLKKEIQGSFDLCMMKAVNVLGVVNIPDKGISKMQIKLLAPEYPTSALDWYGANCTICWKHWKEVIRGD